MATNRLGMLVLCLGLAASAEAAHTQGTVQGPKPFPGASAPPAQPATVNREASPTTLPVYPAAEFLEIIDAGKGQQFHLYGTDAGFAEIVTYYKTALKNAGRVLFQAPLMHQFDLGRYQEETMVYPPSVVIKDYTWNGAEGYLHVTGSSSKRYKTIIQIVPSTTR